MGASMARQPLTRAKPADTPRQQPPPPPLEERLQQQPRASGGEELLASQQAALLQLLASSLPRGMPRGDAAEAAVLLRALAPCPTASQGPALGAAHAPDPQHPLASPPQPQARQPSAAAGPQAEPFAAVVNDRGPPPMSRAPARPSSPTVAPQQTRPNTAPGAAHGRRVDDDVGTEEEVPALSRLRLASLLLNCLLNGEALQPRLSLLQQQAQEPRDEREEQQRLRFELQRASPQHQAAARLEARRLVAEAAAASQGPAMVDPAFGGLACPEVVAGQQQLQQQLLDAADRFAAGPRGSDVRTPAASGGGLGLGPEAPERNVQGSCGPPSTRASQVSLNPSFAASVPTAGRAGPPSGDQARASLVQPGPAGPAADARQAHRPVQAGACTDATGRLVEVLQAGEWIAAMKELEELRQQAERAQAAAASQERASALMTALLGLPGPLAAGPGSALLVSAVLQQQARDAGSLGTTRRDEAPAAKRARLEDGSNGKASLQVDSGGSVSLDVLRALAGPAATLSGPLLGQLVAPFSASPCRPSPGASPSVGPGGAPRPGAVLSCTSSGGDGGLGLPSSTSGGREGSDDADDADDMGLDDAEGDGNGESSRQRAPMPDKYRRVFELPVREAARALNVSMTHLKKKCRQYGIKRWPQRKLASLGKVWETTLADPDFTPVERMAVLATVRRNREDILADPNAPLLSSLLPVRQAQYKRAFETRVRGTR
ncbi:hypothetical protein HYH03_018296 [Edaphochlamys debaryana]|uniref:RWP-RK domain-containing protein n=1 Tax=Edaphochlamys debaryana TaxID=47281 RepID=A0A835XFL2_9CHLO|nr:hypothetical protein HYH03_018296 [Edaphochlamys debaryana]|eukprot:KAG2482806.1 hypothetical protein HYH03_018296 [Edaphochlamys debaryana]